MNSPDYLSGGILFVIGVFVVVYAIISFLLPFFVHSISLHAKRTNQLLEELATLMEQSAEAAEKEAEARSHQAEISITLVRALKDSSEALLTHAQYQTEVTKHRLETETQA
jgi:hypothetical protein